MMGKSSSSQRKQATVTLFKEAVDSYGTKEISDRIKILKEDIYGSVYGGNLVLKTIANNIFDEYRKQLII